MEPEKPHDMGSRIGRVLLGAAIVWALPFAALASAGPAAPVSCGGSSAKLVNLYTFHIEAKPAKKTYRQGDVVKVFVNVTRPAEQDPAGEGNPMPRPTVQPAEGVDVGGALWSDSSYTWDLGRVTDEKGNATLLIRTQDDYATGWARADIVAEKVHYSNNGCPDVKEYGYYTNPRFVKIVPH